MDLEKLFNPVAEYFDFLVDFVKLDGISRFSRLGSVSPKLVSFVILGMIFGIVIKKAKTIPSFSQDVKLSNFMKPTEIGQQQPSQSVDMPKLWDNPDLFILLLLQINGALSFHLSLVIISIFRPFEFGNFKDSLNATLAVSAIQYPLTAVLHRLLTFTVKIQNYDKKTRIIAVFIYIFYFAMSIIPAYYFYKVMQIIHQIPPGYLLAPSLLSVAIILIIFLIAYYFIRVWQKMHPLNS